MTENERVRVVRKSEKLTLEEFGKRLGVTRGAVSAIENAARGLTDQMCRSICREFGIREEWLRTGEGPMKAPDLSRDDLDACLDKWGLPREFRGLFQRYAKLSPAAQKEVVEQVRAWAVDLAAEIAEEEAKPAPIQQMEPTAKPWNEMTKEEKLAEVARQLDEEEESSGEAPQSGSLAAG